MWLFIVKVVVQWINRLGSAVSNGAFLPKQEFAWTEQVENYTPEISAELTKAMQKPITSMTALSNNQNSITSDDSWKTYFLYVYGDAVPQHAAQCPKTMQALAHIPGLKTAFFSILPAQTKIAGHYGPYNGVLRYHLGVKIPTQSGQCGIRVHKDIRHWQQGDSLIFDDSYHHEAWNDSNEVRVVLFVDFIRPMKSPFDRFNAFFYEKLVNQTFNRRFKQNVVKRQQLDS